MNQTVHTSVQYETTDLALASFLRCRSFQLTGLKRSHGKTVFQFADSTPLRAAMLDYANDGHVAVRSFCATMRDLKALTR